MTELRRLRLQSEVNAENTTGTLLGIGAVFTGGSVDLSLNDYVTALVAVFSDVDGAVDGIEIQFSADGGVWFTTDQYSYAGGSGPKTYHIPRVFRYFRVRYTNGAVAQASFVLETTLMTGTARGSSHRLGDDISLQDDAELTKGVIAGEKSDGTVSNIKSTDNNRLWVQPEDPKLVIPSGSIPGQFAINQFGRSENADNDTFTHIWDRANVTHNQPIWLPPTAARIHAIVSSSASDAAAGAGARTVRVFGLTSWNAAEVTEDIVLNGTTPVNTVNSYVIIHRLRVLTSGATSPNVGFITATAATDGTVTAQINEDKGHTQMAIYGIPSTQSAYLTGFFMSILRANLGSSSVVADGALLWVFDVESQPLLSQVRHTIGAQSGGTGYIYHQYNPYKEFIGPGIIIFAGEPGANNIDISGGFDLILLDN